jgi:hypothetical protein
MRLALLAAGWVFAASAGAAQDYKVEGNCRDGQPHGNYELRDGTGAVRAVGAFNRGKRTGSFLFWASNGTRVAQLPFEDDLLSGTAALWWAGPARDGEPRIKLEAHYTRGRLSGTKRSWHPNGRLRAEFRYDQGTLTAARAMSESGKPLPESEARALAARDFTQDDALYASLTNLVNTHLPRCEPGTDRPEKS